MTVVNKVDELLATFVVELDNAIGTDGTDRELAALRDVAAGIWVRRGNGPALRAQIVELVVALDEALHLASVPERNQDEQWYARHKALVEVCDRHEAACPPDAEGPLDRSAQVTCKHTIPPSGVVTVTMSTSMSCIFCELEQLRADLAAERERSAAERESMLVEIQGLQRRNPDVAEMARLDGEVARLRRERDDARRDLARVAEIVEAVRG